MAWIPFNTNEAKAVTIKDFIGKVVIGTESKTRYVLTKVTSPYIEVKTEKLNEYGCPSHYQFETINGDPFTNGVLVFEDVSLTEPFKKVYNEYCHSKDAYWEEYGYWMRKD